MNQLSAFERWVQATRPVTRYFDGKADLMTDSSPGPAYHIGKYREALKSFGNAESGPEAGLYLGTAVIDLAHAVRRVVRGEAGLVNFTGLHRCTAQALGARPGQRLFRVVSFAERCADLKLYDPAEFARAPDLGEVRRKVFNHDFTKFVQDVGVRLGQTDLESQ